MACPATKQEVLDAIKNVNKELDLTIIVVSHLPEIHEYLADRLIWLEKGEIVADGKPRQVLDQVHGRDWKDGASGIMAQCPAAY